MSSPPLPAPPSLSGSDLTGVLPYLAAIVTGLLGFFGARFTGTAQQWAALSGAFHSLMDELQADRARLTARISEQEHEVSSREAEILRLRGEIRGLRQWQDSATRLCKTAGVPLPPEMRQGRPPEQEADNGGG